jgi:hypothetical protein
MGKCIKCNRETKNSYHYYSADKSGSYFEDGNVAHTTTIYRNITTHNDYYCSQHQGSGIITSLIFTIILAVITIFCAVPPTSLLWTIIFGVSALICLSVLIYMIQSTIRDSPCGGDSDIVKIRQAENPSRTYLTVRDYEKIMEHDDTTIKFEE